MEKLFAVKCEHCDLNWSSRTTNNGKAVQHKKTFNLECGKLSSTSTMKGTTLTFNKNISAARIIATGDA